MSAIVIVGAGPRGVGMLERLAASAAELHPGPLDVHLVDPYPAGAGRIWRHDQSPLLAMNSMAADVTMFTDPSVVCAGPVRPGPSFWEWAQRGPAVDQGLAQELRAVTATTFPSRRLQSEYLSWVLAEVTTRLPEGMRVHVHRTSAVGWDGETARLADGARIRADALVLASGHLDAHPTPDEQALAAAAAAAGLRYLPPEQTTDSDLSVIAPGERVLVRGMGLAFVDLMVLLFEGRGGRFEQAGDGLRYVASGREPRLVAGSPRGAPYHAKAHYELRAGRPELPRYFTADTLIAAGGPVALRERAWPAMAKEIAYGWYHELFRGHPERVAVSWAEFAARFDLLDWGSAAMDALVAGAVAEPLDRLDLDALDRPLAGVTAPDLAALQPLVRGHIAEDLRQHVDERHTAHLGAFAAMLSVYGEVTRLAGSGVLSARSRAADLPWWQGFFNAVASGPPGFRVRELLALADAGYVQFLGPGTWVEVEGDRFVAGSAATPETVPAQVLVDARLPEPSLTRTTDPLLAALCAAGDVAEEVLVDDLDETVLRNTGRVQVRPADGAVLDAAGVAHENLFAVGPHTTVKVAGAFTRPGMNSQSLRYNDTVARAVLRAVAKEARAAA